MLTRKDFNALAETIAKLDIPPAHHATVAEAMTSWCASQNPRFDRGRFLAACENGRPKAIDEGGAICADCGGEDFRRESDGLTCRECGSFYDPSDPGVA